MRYIIMAVALVLLNEKAVNKTHAAARQLLAPYRTVHYSGNILL
jgi:hypothetical protein